MIRIIDFSPEHNNAFRELNEAWITRYFELEDSDLKMLNDPKSHILDKGGAILIATLDDQVVGTCALIKMEGDQFELAKMAVDPSAQGQSIGYKLGLAILEKAKSLKARAIFLETNSQLKPAIGLYKKLGFKEIEGPESPYSRCNIQMELKLSYVP